MANAETTAILEVLQEALVTQVPQPQAQPDQHKVVAEAFDKVRAILGREDRGWTPIYGASADVEFGLTLEDLKGWSAKIRESVVGGSWMGQGFRLRHSYVWQNGIRFGNIPKPTKGKTNIQNLIDDPLNQLHFFSKDARRKRELSLYADGVAFWIGNDATKKIEAIPLNQIVDQILDPDGLGLVWAYKRQWSVRNLKTGAVEPKVEWYFADRFTSERVPHINETAARGGSTEQRVPVSQTHTIFDMHANGMTGMPYGSPDALAAYVFNGIVRGAYMDGVAMVKALASFALKASVKTAGAGNAASLQLASPQGAGQTAVLGGANDLVPMASAGKGYDFTSLSSLTAIIATSLSVPNAALTSDTSNEGSGQVLDLPVRLAMEARRDDHIELDRRVLRWLGMKDAEPDVGFVPYAAGEETYRSAQSIILGLEHDVYSRQETRDQLDDLFGRPNGITPSEDQRPSILSAKALAKAVPKPDPAATPDEDRGASAGAPQVASPNQGRSNGTGGQVGGNASNDIRRQ